MFSTKKDVLENLSSEEDINFMDFIVQLAPALQKLIPLDCMLGVADTKKIIVTVPGEKIKLPGDPIGMEIPKEDAMYKAINTRNTVRMIVPKEAFGFEFQSTAVPIFDKNGKVVGALGLGIGLENREKLVNNAHMVATSAEQTSATIEELAASATQLAIYHGSLQTLAQEITEQINETGKIIEIIRGVAHTSNMLGLNAAIEAARAGEQGKGFSVVATEIRKMAENSTNAIKDVENILNKIKEKIVTIDEKINETSAIGQQQAAATEELSSAMQELANSADNLNQAAGSVVG